MSIFNTDSASFNSLQITGSVIISSSNVPTQIIGSGSNIFIISGSNGEIFKVQDTSSSNIFTFSSGSLDIINIDTSPSVSISASSFTYNGERVQTFIAQLVLGSTITTGANTSSNNLTGLVFNYLPYSTYRFDMYMLVQSNANTTGVGFGISCSTAVSQSILTFFHQLANTGTLSGGNTRTSDGLSIGVSSGTNGANIITPVHGCGILITGADSGSAQFTFRAEVAAVTNCISGSVVIIEKVR